MDLDVRRKDLEILVYTVEIPNQRGVAGIEHIDELAFCRAAQLLGGTEVTQGSDRQRGHSRARGNKNR